MAFCVCARISAAAGPNKSKRRLLCERGKKETVLGAGSRPSAAGADSFKKKRGGWRTGDEKSIARLNYLPKFHHWEKTMDHPRQLIVKLIMTLIGMTLNFLFFSCILAQVTQCASAIMLVFEMKK